MRPAPSPTSASPVADTLRAVAVTFDDLPGVVRGGLPRLQQATSRLLRHISAYDIPAVGFVNEAKLEHPGEEDARIALLRQWVEAGLELGNHTYAHVSLHATPLDAYQEDVLKGEVVTRPLMQAHGMTLRYFRHPYLRTGTTLETKAAFADFLAAQGYTIAPVTIDNGEWIYAAAYEEARGDSALMRRIGEAYVAYMNDVFGFYEQFSEDLLGYQVKHILLLHANALNADYFDDMAAMMQRRGYTFITLEEALRDSAYQRSDAYTGSAGVSWLQRWAVGQGQALRDEPPVHAFVRDLTGF